MKATQLEVTDGTGTITGGKKLLSYFMMFDIATASGNAPSMDVPVELLLVKDGVTAPTTLAEFRATKAVTLDGFSATVTPAYKSIIKTTGATSLYLAHDSEIDDTILLEPNGTNYMLYYVEPGSTDETPKALGPFATGTPVDGNTYTDMPYAEDPGTSAAGGTFYIVNNQYMHYMVLLGNVPTSFDLVSGRPFETFNINTNSIFTNGDPNTAVAAHTDRSLYPIPTIRPTVQYASTTKDLWDSRDTSNIKVIQFSDASFDDTSEFTFTVFE